MTVTIDMQELLGSVVGEIPPYSGDPEDEWQPTYLHNEIIGAAAQIVAEKLMKDAKSYQGLSKALKQAIEEKLAEMIEEELVKPYAQLDTYGEVKRGAEPITLRDQIKTQVDEALKKSMAPSDRYNNDPAWGALRKFIDNQIAAVLQKDFADAIAKGKKEVLDKIEKNAAEVIAKTIAKPPL